MYASTPTLEVDEQYERARHFGDKLTHLYLLGTSVTKVCLSQISNQDDPDTAITAWLAGWDDNSNNDFPNTDIPYTWRDMYQAGWGAAYAWGEAQSVRGDLINV